MPLLPRLVWTSGLTTFGFMALNMTFLDGVHKFCTLQRGPRSHWEKWDLARPTRSAVFFHDNGEIFVSGSKVGVSPQKVIMKAETRGVALGLHSFRDKLGLGFTHFD